MLHQNLFQIFNFPFVHFSFLSFKFIQLRPHLVETTEALATHRAVVFAKELSIFKVMVEGDCLRVVQALKA